ncbi:MAG: hypothetical protein AAB446_00210 [Patescibacteria group bacterium]|mgnify:CR=1 FL=1
MEEEYIKSEDFGDLKGESWKAKFEAFLNSRYFVAVALVLIAIIAFSLGRISGLQDKREPVRVISGGGEVKGVSDIAPQPPSYVKRGEEQAISPVNSGSVVASKSGTKYHYPWCAGAKQISPKNLITFNSIEEARAKGYTPASNCKGLK